MNNYKVLVVGAGKIGAFFDSPSSKNIITHAHAFTEHPGFELTGFVDTDGKMGQRAADLWGGKYFSTIDEAFSSGKIDVVSVCVPDDFHYDLIKKLLNKPVKLIFAEKPITKTVEEAQEIVKLSRHKNIPILVNYSRRFVPQFEHLAQKINSGEFGELVAGNGLYGKGLVHNGTHMIDLIHFLLAPIESAKYVGMKKDFFKNDPSISAELKIKNGGVINMIAVDCSNFSIFELDLLFKKGRVRILDSGNLIEEYSPTASKIHSGYKYLQKNNSTKTALNRAIYIAADNIYKNLTQKEALKCRLEDAILDLTDAALVRKKAGL